jgi:hypothetical protein
MMPTHDAEDNLFYSVYKRMLISSRNIFPDTPRNNEPIIWALHEPVKLKQKINHHIPQSDLKGEVSISEGTPEGDPTFALY